MLALETALRDRLRKSGCHLRVCGHSVRFYRWQKPASGTPGYVHVGFYTLGTGTWQPERGPAVACGDLMGAVDCYEAAVAGTAAQSAGAA